MKKLIAILTVVIIGLSVPASAVPTSLGDWNLGDPCTTHQIWHFTPGYVVGPIPLDGYNAKPEVVDNPLPLNVTASISVGGISHGTWAGVTMFTSDRAISVNLELPNYPILEGYKVIWVDIGNSIAEDISITATPTSIPFLYEILPGQGDAEFGVMIWPNPEVEKIGFVVYPTSCPAMLDYIRVDTICVPEPATICMLGLGALSLIRRKR
jgi:hypothetical protein